MSKEYSISVRVPLETWQQFMEMVEATGRTKTDMIETLIDRGYIEWRKCERERIKAEEK